MTLPLSAGRHVVRVRRRRHVDRRSRRARRADDGFGHSELRQVRHQRVEPVSRTASSLLSLSPARLGRLRSCSIALAASAQRPSRRSTPTRLPPRCDASIRTTGSPSKSSSIRRRSEGLPDRSASLARAGGRSPRRPTAQRIVAVRATDSSASCAPRAHARPGERRGARCRRRPCSKPARSRRSSQSFKTRQKGREATSRRSPSGPTSLSRRPGRRSLLRDHQALAGRGGRRHLP